jgi:hypothetical protein
LSARRAAARSELARAGSRRAQAVVAAGLASEYAGAGRRLGDAVGGTPSDRDLAALAAGLRRTGAAYARLADAGRSNSAANWRAARSQVWGLEAQLQRAVAALKRR